MKKALPARPNLEHLKSQAKDLLRAFRRKERAALERFQAALPAVRGVDLERLSTLELALHDAQSVIAREYGFDSFAELRAHVERAETLNALLEPHLSAPLPDPVQQALLGAPFDPPEVTEVPPLLPLLPIRNAVLAMGALAPFHIGRAASLAAIEAARTGDGLLAVFAQKEEAVEAPDAAALHPVGCAARLLEVVPQHGGAWIAVRATAWIRLEALEQREPWLVARVARFTVEARESEQARELERALRERVQGFIEKLPAPGYLRALTQRMTALELADAAIANLPATVEEKARYASEPDLVRRLEFVLGLLDRAA
jgi:Lon protease-like protein